MKYDEHSCVHTNWSQLVFWQAAIYEDALIAINDIRTKCGYANSIEDLPQGELDNYTTCPVAMALRDAMHIVRVRYDEVYVVSYVPNQVFQQSFSSDRLTLFLQLFDRGWFPHLIQGE